MARRRALCHIEFSFFVLTAPAAVNEHMLVFNNERADRALTRQLRQVLVGRLIGRPGVANNNNLG